MWDSDAELAVLPLGSGNDFARSHGIPRDLRGAVAVIRDGRSTTSDVGRFGERYFFNTLGIGFTVDVTRRSRKIKFLRGLPLYLTAVFQSLRTYRSTDVKISAPDFHRGSPTYFVTIGIGICEGGGFMLTPDALTDDGEFDVCMVDDVTAWTALRVLPRAMTGRHTDHPAVTMRRTASLELTAPEPMVMHADGELYDTGATHLEVACLPGRLNVRVPALHAP